ncbi:MAG: RnfABCDGE type electron transport complex subunit D [Gammaproteobacteria bacterium]|nr:RnfABCDGE type electron transport complex subunit D [Gammaproteobacteria bacterium]MDD9824175.1 RnfABCDGE type electron transport complex subunit D [Gammaproteobacteria bacterium]MDD9863691.1 RnfABCDGE type electron transport complex subunit D [Gammaproteobacteria bacterium]
MSAAPVSSPHLHAGTSVAALMREVLAALAPGLLLSCWLFGPRLLLHLAVASLTALACEALALRLRGLPLRPALTDGSALVTAWLLALCISPLADWWLSAAGAAFAILVVKHCYGGLGRNLFNPAMAGYVFVLLCFPVRLSLWPAAPGLDTVSGATPLGYVQSGLAGMATLEELRAAPVFGAVGGRGWEWLAPAWLAGGCWLLARRLIDWRIPAAMLLALFCVAALFYLYDDQRHASPWFHLASGGALLGAFFVATDPATSATTAWGRVLYGAGIGLLAWSVRRFGGFPDGVAFAVLIMNAAVPLIDRITRPRVLGTSA